MAQWALITGASEGIGRELASVLAAAHWNLALVARNQARLEQLAAEVHHRHGVETAVLPRDLAEPRAAAAIFHDLTATPIEALINNAGFGSYGKFPETELKLQTDMMQVNMRALVELTHLFLGPMLARRHGRILNVASTAAFQPGPTVNIYYATKAFVYSFSYALAEELEGSGVTVTTLCPGLTRTRFLDRARLHLRTNWAAMDPNTVAQLGYRGMMKGKRVVIPGALNRLASFVAKRMPPRLTSFFVRRLHAPRQSSPGSGHSTP